MNWKCCSLGYSQRRGPLWFSAFPHPVTSAVDQYLLTTPVRRAVQYAICAVSTEPPSPPGRQCHCHSTRVSWGVHTELNNRGRLESGPKHLTSAVRCLSSRLYCFLGEKWEHPWAFKPQTSSDRALGWAPCTWCPFEGKHFLSPFYIHSPASSCSMSWPHDSFQPILFSFPGLGLWSGSAGTTQVQ